MDYIVVNCPHCKEVILIYLKELNCHIFRHGIYKNNHKQIDPHLDKKTCDYLFENNLIYGCGKPFKIVNQNNIFSAEKCDYI
tara:strand:- start:1317 stop:1562 length:246 start_codon:yes stop_codon:yes gene_type:complete